MLCSDRRGLGPYKTTEKPGTGWSRILILSMLPEHVHYRHRERMVDMADTPALNKYRERVEDTSVNAEGSARQHAEGVLEHVRGKSGLNSNIIWHLVTRKESPFLKWGQALGIPHR